MRRFLVGAAVVAAMALVGAIPAGADPAGGVQPACADITSGGAQYFTSTDTVTGGVHTAAPSCRGFVYTLWIAYKSSGSLVERAQPVLGNGSPAVTFDITNVAADDDVVCVRATSSRGPTVYDWAPDSSEGTQPVDPGSGLDLNCSSFGWSQAFIDFSGAIGGFN